MILFPLFLTSIIMFGSVDSLSSDFKFLSPVWSVLIFASLCFLTKDIWDARKTVMRVRVITEYGWKNLSNSRIR